MSKDDRDAFLKWHSEKDASDSIFDFQKEMEDMYKTLCLVKGPSSGLNIYSQEL